MNLTLHLAAWDLRYLRHYLGLWLGLVILQAGLIGSYAQSPDLFPLPWSMVLEVFLPVLVWLVAILKICLLAVIVAQLVQKDSTIGSTAFWLSRPVSSFRLLGGKALFLVLAVILPTLLVEVGVLFVCGVTPHDALRSVPQILFLTLLALAALMMLAVVTVNFARLILLGIMAFVILPLLGLILALLLPLSLMNNPSALWISKMNLPTWGAPLVFVATAAMVIANQYLTRRTILSRILLLAGVSIALLFTTAWTWESWVWESRIDREILDPAKVTARIEETSLVFDAGKAGPGPVEANDLLLRGRIALGNLPPDVLAHPVQVSSDLHLPSGKGPVSHFSYGPLECIGSSWFQPEGGMGQGNAAFLGEMLGGIDILDMERLRPPPELFAISESLYEQFRGVATVYSARVQFLVQRHEAAAMRLEKRTPFDRGSHRIEVLSVDGTGRGMLTIHLGESRHGLREPNKTEIWYLLINRPRRQALLGSTSSSALSSPPLLSGILPMLEVRRWKLDFDPLPFGFEIDAAWLEKAELIRVETSNLGCFSKRVRMEDLVMEQIPRRTPAP